MTVSACFTYLLTSSKARWSGRWRGIVVHALSTTRCTGAPCCRARLSNAGIPRMEKPVGAPASAAGATEEWHSVAEELAEELVEAARAEAEMVVAVWWRWRWGRLRARRAAST